MTLNILFICEGNAEVFLLYKILKEEFKIEIEEKNLTNDGNLNMKEIKQFTFLGKVNNNNIYIGNISGVKNLNSVYVTELIESSQFYKLDKILFIMDADYGDNNESGFTRMEKSITDIIKKIQETKNIKTAYFISPNNRDDGMIENLLIEAMKCKKIKEYIKSVTLKYMINDEEIPSVEDEKYNFKVIQYFDFEITDIKKDIIEEYTRKNIELKKIEEQIFSNNIEIERME